MNGSTFQFLSFGIAIIAGAVGAAADNGRNCTTIRAELAEAEGPCLRECYPQLSGANITFTGIVEIAEVRDALAFC